MALITVNADQCKMCGTCVATCPETVLVQKEKRTVPVQEHADLCLSCGQCVAVCPAGAISHEAFPAGTVTEINKDLLPSPEQVMELLRTRRSVRAFRDTPVPRETLETVLDAARYAPSAHNNQSTEYLVITDHEMLDKISSLAAENIAATAARFRDADALAELKRTAPDETESALYLLPDLDRITAEVAGGKDTVLFNAPALIIFHALKTADMGAVNAQLALSQTMLAAHATGLGTFYAGYVTAACRTYAALQQLLDLPDNHVVHGVLAVGQPKFRYRHWMERNPVVVTWK